MEVAVSRDSSHLNQSYSICMLSSKEAVLGIAVYGYAYLERFLHFIYSSDVFLTLLVVYIGSFFPKNIFISCWITQ